MCFPGEAMLAFKGTIQFDIDLGVFAHIRKKFPRLC